LCSNNTIYADRSMDCLKSSNSEDFKLGKFSSKIQIQRKGHFKIKIFLNAANLEEQKGLVTCAHAMSRGCVTNNIEIVCFCESTASNVTLFLSSVSKHLNIYDGKSMRK
jgi:hypothetical protein